MDKHKDSPDGITRISVKGFKSLAREVSVTVAPLTILGGANSSGKSSILQPLLLLKQTLEANFDPGALLLSGPNVNFTSISQLLSRVGTERSDTLEVALSSGGNGIKSVFRRDPKGGLGVVSTQYEASGQKTVVVHPDMAAIDFNDLLSEGDKAAYEMLSGYLRDLWPGSIIEPVLSAERARCFLQPQLVLKRKQEDGGVEPSPAILPVSSNILTVDFVRLLKAIIHLPGLRGSPERTYPVTGVGSDFPGTFHAYTASVIALWQRTGDGQRLESVGKELESMGLSWHVRAQPVEDTQVEIKVSRLPHRSGSAEDDVSIADVGLGLSQVLPLIVALHVAAPGQLVYLEQPEIHLHPRAQSRFGKILVDAAKRGVRVVLETHSSLLLLAIQTAVAEKQIEPSDVCLHWFSRDADGITDVRSAALDENGAFGEWPEDFADTNLEAESRYLNAAEQIKPKVH
ncbi:MAG TPA: DUF3696 domain-containing protein [Candidatus Saccharimonadales bacterium]|jgi:hypothetical protein|nr:DUF3696 domain-containing protein [Candidatus Saccharimonadales bacterium]